MRVLFITTEIERPSTHNRVVLYRPFLENRGVEMEIVVCPAGADDRRALFDRSAEYDVVVLQKRLLRRRPFLHLRRRARCLVFDYDDAILYRGPDSDRPHSMMRRFRFRRIVEGADRVWASTPYLRDLAGQYVEDPEKILVLPTAIDMNEFPARPYPDTPGQEKVVLGWLGGPGNLPYVEDLRPVLNEIGGRRSSAVLRIVSQEFLEFEHLPVDPVMWEREREIEQIQGFDIGLSPLRNDLWSQGKMPLKTQYYYGVAVPAVGSPVGSNPDIIQHGKTGYIASGADEWIEYVCNLIDHPEKRREFGTAGRKHVAANFSLQALGPVMWRDLVELAGGREA